MADFDDFLENLKKGLEELAKKNWAEFREAAEKDGKAFVEKTKEDLRRWTKLLAQGDLSKDDFEFLVAGKKDLAEMEALRQAGLTLVRLERFQNALISLVIDTAFETFL
jgi:hypothetical protein